MRNERRKGVLAYRKKEVLVKREYKIKKCYIDKKESNIFLVYSFLYQFRIERKNFKKRKRERNYRKEGRALYQRKREKKSSR
jgi:hypothetical protein